METRAWIFRVLFSGTAVLAGTACPGLDQANLDETGESGGDGGTATTLPTTAGMTMTTAGMTMTGGGSGDATSGSSDGGTTLNVSGTDGTTTDIVPEPTETSEGGMTTDSTTAGPGESTSTGNPTTGGCTPSAAGQWGDCAHGGTCDAEGSCTTIGSQGDACMFSGCDDICDCPPVPGTGNPTLACADVAGVGGPDEVPECYLSCEAGEMCPDGMECLQGTFCGYPTVIVDYYEGCESQGYGCPEDAYCLDLMGGVSSCLPSDCGNPSECPDVSGATEACSDINGGATECYLSCNNDVDCPADFVCEQSILCVQDDP